MFGFTLLIKPFILIVFMRILWRRRLESVSNAEIWRLWRTYHAIILYTVVSKNKQPCHKTKADVDNGNTSPEDIKMWLCVEALVNLWQKQCMCCHLSYLSWATQWSSRCCSAVHTTEGHPPSDQPHSHLRTRRSSPRTPWLPQNGPA